VLPEGSGGAAAPAAPAAAPAAPAVAAAPAGGRCGRRGGGAAAGATKAKAKEPPAPKVSFREMLRYARGADKCLIVISCAAAALNGLIFPGFSLIFGELLNLFNDASAGGDFVADIERYALWFLLLSVGAGLFSFLESALAIVTAERQVRRVREAYLRALLRQPVAYFDVNKGGEMAASLVEDTLTLMNGLSDKISSTFKYTITFLAGIAVGFARSWQLTLTMFTLLPLIVIVMGALAFHIRTFESRSAAAYAKAGDAATETFASIRTVAAFGGEEHEIRRYDAHLAVAEKSGSSKGVWIGAAVGSVFGSLFIGYGLCSLVGAVLIVKDRESNPACYNPLTPGCFTGGTIVQTLMAVLIGSFSVAQIGPNVSAIFAAQVAAHKLFSVIDLRPTIDAYSTEGATPAPASLTGTIEFRNVSFAYPSRKETVIFRNFNLTIRGGAMTALVGASGCGKSTLMQLLLRNYDVDDGVILVDGTPIKDWNLRHLRERIGVVSQEPVRLVAVVLGC
jgi:ATP-binding cassette subfamily B (MDR/TAP) protein 1